MPDPLFFVPVPHADMHAVIAPQQQLQLRMDLLMASESSDPAQKRYDVNSVFNKTIGSQTFTVKVDFLAHHLEPPHRFDALPTVDATGLVTATTPGVFLFQMNVLRMDTQAGTSIGSVVGRLQVHQQVEDWWFGNKSITTAKDDIGHAQPTIYAKFNAHPSGTDLVGDITGHGYVTLTSGDTSKVEIAPHGRLRGVVETATPVTVTGKMLPAFPNKTQPLPVRVLDYAKPRGNELEVVKLNHLKRLTEQSNVVFIAEGFPDTPADKALFKGTVKAAVNELFKKPRHDPFGMLEKSFNVFQLFAPSQERGLTTGFQVTDTAISPSKAGLPIPFDGTIEAISKNHKLSRLVQVVGMPRRGENRAPGVLKALWVKQRPDFAAELNAVPDALVDVWKTHRADAFLDAVDTRFGIYLGSRLADGDPIKRPAVARPATDPPATSPDFAQMNRFVDRLYFFFTKDQVTVGADPRRHPPELFGDNLTNPNISILNYLTGQTYLHPRDNPSNVHKLGKEWAPDDSKRTLSRGLVVLVTYEDLRGGTAFNRLTMVGVTVGTKPLVTLGPVNTAQPERLNRVVPAPPPPPPTPPPPNFRQNLGIVNLDYFTNVVAHEVGHMYALGDEYEVRLNGDHPDSIFPGDAKRDNITGIGFIRFPAPPPSPPNPPPPPPPRAPNRGVDPDKVKWLVLPRMRISSKLVQTAQPSNGTIDVKVGLDDIPKWAQVFAQNPNTLVSLRKITSDARRFQLPLQPRRADEFQDNLKILQAPNPTTGVIRLSFTTGLPNPPPRFPAGSALFLQQVNNQQQPVFVVDAPVLALLRQTHRPMNVRPNPKVGENAPEDPKPGFTAPAKNKFRTVGLYEGAFNSSEGYYRPTGACKMRDQEGTGERGGFCFVCRWLIVNVVDPGQHVLLDEWYPGGKRG